MARYNGGATWEFTQMDLREYIDHLDNAGYLKRINTTVSWRYELGKIAREVGGPVLFEAIGDYPGARLFTNGQSSTELVARALGLSPGLTLHGLRRAIAERFRNPLAPVLRNSGPVMAHHVKQRSIDLASLPVPWWSEHDGGRYIGTWHLNVTRSPESGIRNLGTYRMQILDAESATVSVSPHSHLARHAAAAHQHGRPLEMAVAIGVAEPTIMAAAASFPYGVDEYEYAGALAGKPVELVKCSTVDLEVPADAEYVLEGSIVPSARVHDGPYMDYAGIPNVNPRAFLFKVGHIMHRDRPIFRGTSVGKPGAEDHVLFGILAGLGLVDFHGSGVRQRIQNALLRRSMFRLFQMTGRIGKLLH